LTHATALAGYEAGMTSGHDPDKIDPSDQSGRPVMLTGALIGLLLAITVMVVVFFLAR